MRLETVLLVIMHNDEDYSMGIMYTFKVKKAVREAKIYRRKESGPFIWPKQHIPKKQEKGNRGKLREEGEASFNVRYLGVRE